MRLRNVEMTPIEKPSNFRKMSMGNWNGIGDPQVYALLEIDCTRLIPYLQELSQQHDTKMTVNHLVGRSMALVLRKYPRLNGLVTRGKVYLRKDVDIFFQVGLENAETELVGVCLRHADELGLVEFSRRLNEKTKNVRASPQDPMRKAQNPFGLLPWRIIPWAIKLTTWLQYGLNLNLAFLGIPRDPCGSLAITGVGTFGMEMVFVPLTIIGRTPVQIAVGAIHPRPAVVDNQVAVRPMLNLCCTFDHRMMDGILGSRIAKMLTDLLENADQHRDLLEGRASIETYQPKPLLKSDSV